MSKLLMAVAIAHLLTAVSVRAEPVSGAANYKVLSAIYLETKKQYEEAKKHLESLQAANDTLQDINSFSKDLVHEYKFVKNFSLESEIQNIVTDIDNLTMIDELIEHGGDMDWTQKLSYINAEVDRRIARRRANGEDITDDEEKALKDAYIAMLKNQEAERAKLAEAAAASAGKMNDKNLSSSMASSLAILAALELAKKKKEQQDMMARKEGMAKSDKALSKFLKNKDKPGTFR